MLRGLSKSFDDKGDVMYSEVRLEVSNSTALCDGGKKFASSAEVTVLDVSGAAVYSTSLIQAIEEGLRQNPGQRKRFALVTNVAVWCLFGGLKSSSAGIELLTFHVGQLAAGEVDHWIETGMAPELNGTLLLNGLEATPLEPAMAAAVITGAVEKLRAVGALSPTTAFRLGELGFRNGCLDLARDLAQQGLLSSRDDDPNVEARGLRLLAETQIEAQNFDSGISLLTEALNLSQSVGNVDGQLTALSSMAFAGIASERWTVCEQACNDALALAKAHSYQGNLALVFHNLATAQLFMGRFSEADANAQRAYSLRANREGSHALADLRIMEFAAARRIPNLR